MYIPASLVASLLAREGHTVSLFGNGAAKLDGIGLYDKMGAHRSWVHYVDIEQASPLDNDYFYLFVGTLPENPPDNYVLVEGPGYVDGRLVYNFVNDCFYLFNSWDSKLREAMARNEGIDALIDCSLDIMQNPITVYDTTMQLIGCGGIARDMLERYYVQIGGRWFLPPEKLEVSKEKDIPIMIKRSKRAMFDYTRTPPHLECPITLGDESLGLLIIPMNLKELSRDYLTIAEHLAGYMAQVLDQRFRSNANMSLLITGESHDTTLMEYHCNVLGWDPNGVFQVLVFKPANNALASEVDLTRNRLALDRLFANSFTSTVRGDYVSVVHRPENVLRKNSCSNVQRYLVQSGLIGGCSLPFKGFSEVADHYEQASYVLGRSTETLGFYAGHLPEHMINEFATRRTSCNYLHPTVALLEENDPDGMLRETLYRYLTCDRSHTATSERLHIHKSTLKYRLDKIKSVIGESYLNDEERLDILLSLKMSLR